MKLHQAVITGYLTALLFGLGAHVDAGKWQVLGDPNLQHTEPEGLLNAGKQAINTGINYHISHDFSHDFQYTCPANAISWK